MDWFRCWNDIIDDPKLLRMTPAHRWVWMAVMVLANKSPKRGSLYVSERLPCDFDDLVRVSRESPDVVREALTAFESSAFGMLEKDENGAWAVKNWKKRQPSKDNVAERVAKTREKKRNKGTDDETTQLPLEGVTGNTLVTPPDSDTDPDAEGEERTDEDAGVNGPDSLGQSGPETPGPEQTERPPSPMDVKGALWHEHVQRKMGHLGTYDYEKIEKIRSTHGLSHELTIAVFDWCYDNATRSPVGFFLREFPKVGSLNIRTVEDFKNRKQAQRTAQTSGRNPQQRQPQPAARTIDEFTDEDFLEGA